MTTEIDLIDNKENMRDIGFKKTAYVRSGSNPK